MSDAPSTDPAVFQALVDAGIEFSIYFAPQRGFDVTIADSAIGVRNYQPGIQTLPECISWLDERAGTLFPERNYVRPNASP
jgi:hypothetical protein